MPPDNDLDTPIYGEEAIALIPNLVDDRGKPDILASVLRGRKGLNGAARLP